MKFFYLNDACPEKWSFSLITCVKYAIFSILHVVSLQVFLFYFFLNVKYSYLPMFT